MGAGLLTPHNAALLTDYYELTMMAGYFEHRRANKPAVFEYFFRQLPAHTGFCIFAGLGDLLPDIENLRFDDSAIRWLRDRGAFRDEFLEYLHDFRFSGDIWAASEGTPVFPNEPILRVHAPMAEGQLLETLILNRLNYQTLIATKAARVCFAADGDPVIEFGLRRAQGPDGGVSGSRAAYIGGCAATSNVLAGKLMDIPVTGTMAHSWVMSYPTEEEAFNAFLDAFPESPVLLIDTYDTAGSGLPTAVRLFEERRARGWKGRVGVRLDSGDLALLSKLAHKELSQAGFADALIVASNSLNEDLIADLKRQGAKVNSWGVGTELVTGGDEPALGGVYKLVALLEDGSYVSKMKVSSNPEKTTDPGVKTPVRFYDTSGYAAGDVMFSEEENIPEEGSLVSHDRIEYHRLHRFPSDAERHPILEKVMTGGKTIVELPGVRDIRSYAQQSILQLRPELRRLRNPERYWVGLSTSIADKKAEEMRRLTQ